MQTEEEIYSLNLSPKYAPSWGAWEVAREVICNAIDASEDSMEITTNEVNELIVRTPTVPDLGQLFIIGEGTKAPGGGTIGQFGEGLKLAALVVSRAVGGSLTLLIPGKQITFGFRSVYGVEVLHALVEPHQHADGYEARIVMHGIALGFAGRLLPDRTAGPIQKAASGMRVYCKGVFVSEESVNSIWDWNLADIAINRDRSMVERSALINAVASWLSTNMTDEHADAMIAHSTHWESGQVLSIWHNFTGSCDKLAAAFIRRHGERALLESPNDVANLRAKQDGYTIPKISEELRYRLQTKIRTPEDVLEKNYDLESVPITPYYQKQIDSLRRLDAVVGAPSTSISIFANRDDGLWGRAAMADHRIWLSEGLFTEGNDLTLVRTYLHEMAHIMSGAKDATKEFENALDGICGRLAMKVLGGSQ